MRGKRKIGGKIQQRRREEAGWRVGNIVMWVQPVYGVQPVRHGSC